MKALLGDHEALDSHPRMISEEHYWYKQKISTTCGKFDRMGYKVTRKDASKHIDATQDYVQLLDMIKNQIKEAKVENIDGYLKQKMP